MKLADLKRIPIGTKLRLIRCLVGATPGNNLRVVEKVQSNGVWFRRPEEPEKKELTWLDFPKASDFQADEDGFTVFATNRYEGSNPRTERAVAAQYKFVKE
jgi:hypothetical protein